MEKLKLSLCLTKRYAMKAHVGVTQPFSCLPGGGAGITPLLRYGGKL
jgi:hypothetical protein